MKLWLLPLVVTALGAESNWPQYRGNSSNGLGEGSPAVEWDGVKGKNIKWKTPIPGLGYSRANRDLTEGISAMSEEILSNFRRDEGEGLGESDVNSSH